MPATRPSLFLISLLAISMCCSMLTAQDSATGSIRGIVLDPSGARVPQASVVVVNAATSTRYVTISDGEGRFVVELLPPGD